MRDARPKRTLAALALLAGVGASGVAQAQESLTLTITHYNDRGTTYSGTQTRPGVAACSWGFEIGERLRLPSGTVVTCEDRGQLGAGRAWVDVWVPTRAEALERGRYTATVEVLR